MGIAALILGIISFILSFIPICGLVGLLPAIIGLILGIVEVVKKSKAGEPKGLGIAGIILTSIALIVSIVWNLVVVAAIGVAASEYEDYNSLYNSSYYYN